RDDQRGQAGSCDVLRHGRAEGDPGSSAGICVDDQSDAGGEIADPELQLAAVPASAQEDEMKSLWVEGSLDDWRKLLADREARLIRLREVDAPAIVIEREKELIKIAKRAIQKRS